MLPPRLSGKSRRKAGENAVKARQERAKVKEMITEIIPLEDYQKIYGSIELSRSIASILKYNENGNHQNRRIYSNTK